MALTKISRGLLDTGVSDSSDATAITIDSSENVAIGSSTANKKFNIADSAQGGEALKLHFEAASSTDKWGIYAYDRTNSHYANMSLGQNAIWINGADANIGIGSTSPVAPLTIDDKATFSFNVNDVAFGHHLYYDSQVNDRWERLSGYAGSALYQTAGTMVFYRTSAGGSTGDAVTPSESMRIDDSGRLLIGTTNSSSTATDTGLVLTDGHILSRSSAQAGIFKRTSSNGIIFIFRNTGDTRVGTIETSASSTSYNTSSDYRLKENVSYDWDATTRLKQLKPARFNWIEDETNTVVDGFLAHEVSDIVPEAITGEKDATETLSNVVLNSDNKVIAEDISEDDWTAGKVDTLWTEEDELPDGVSVGDVRTEAIYPSDSTWEASHTIPDYQGIDQAKLVPLLVKTIQELEARITTLENA